MKLDDLLALLPDNTTGEISPADMRTIVTSLYGDANPPYLEVIGSGPITLAAAATFTPIPGAVGMAGNIGFDVPTVCQVVISGNVDSVVNNNTIQLALALTGATVVPAGTHPEQVLYVGGKQAVASTLEVTYLQTFQAGTTTGTVEYTASLASATVSGLALLVTAVAEA